MKKLFLIHFNEAEALDRVHDLKTTGLRIVFEPFTSATFKALRTDPPTVILIDLTRLPSSGRDIGISLRKFKTTRLVPLIYAGGAPEKVELIKKLLPDATYCSWDEAPAAIRRALKHQPTEVHVPDSIMAAYENRSLADKVQIRPGTNILLVGAPEGYSSKLGKLPDNVTVHHRPQGKADQIFWFVTRLSEIERRLPKIVSHLAERGGLWMIWPKKNSGIESDLTQAAVRKHLMANDLVDHKICRFDDTWTSLRFVVRKRQ
ncbi:MAG TPA: hypothetical protein PLF13_02740 [candidate division Zixibacteria bacterium]|nr:hypothetical protein [candidate division Zixibacteria bacterium]